MFSMLDRKSAPSPDKRSEGVAAILIAVVGLSLGSTMVKSTGSPGPVVAFWRLLIGAVLWHVFIAVRGHRNQTSRVVDRAAWRAATLPGIAFGVNLSFFFSGVTRTPIAHAEFIGALTPLIIVPIAAYRLKEPIQRYLVICGVFALSGVTLILSSADAKGTSYIGDLMVLAANMFWITYLLLSKKARTLLSTPHFMTVMTSAACLTTLPIALITAGSPAKLGNLSTKGWVLIVVMAITSGMISHGLIAWAQQRIPVGTISLLQLGQPGLGVLWAATFLGESVKSIQLVGMAVVLAAVGTIAWRSAQKPSDQNTALLNEILNEMPDTVVITQPLACSARDS